MVLLLCEHNGSTRFRFACGTKSQKAQNYNKISGFVWFRNLDNLIPNGFGPYTTYSYRAKMLIHKLRGSNYETRNNNGANNGNFLKSLNPILYRTFRSGSDRLK